jgi:hypothetical protein
MLVLELAVPDADELIVEGRDDREELELIERRKIPIVAIVFILSLSF